MRRPHNIRPQFGFEPVLHGSRKFLNRYTSLQKVSYNFLIRFFFVCLANLHSKEDLAREEAADACKRLAQQITDSGAIEALLKKVFDVFHGSDGKLTVVTHKISVLQVRARNYCGFSKNGYVFFCF